VVRGMLFERGWLVFLICLFVSFRFFCDYVVIFLFYKNDPKISYPLEPIVITWNRFISNNFNHACIKYVKTLTVGRISK